MARALQMMETGFEFEATAGRPIGEAGPARRQPGSSSSPTYAGLDGVDSRQQAV